MVAKHILIQWAEDLETAKTLVTQTEIAMLKAGYIRMGQQTQDRLNRVENNLSSVIWLLENSVKQPSLFEKEETSTKDISSGGGAPWD